MIYSFFICVNIIIFDFFSHISSNSSNIKDYRLFHPFGNLEIDGLFRITYIHVK